jgi:hypothetical protein
MGEIEMNDVVEEEVVMVDMNETKRKNSIKELRRRIR